jgi:hypothetical protein
MRYFLGAFPCLPLISTPALSSQVPKTVPILPVWSDSMGKGTSPFAIFESSLSCHILCTKWLSTLTESTSAPRGLNVFKFGGNCRQFGRSDKGKISGIEREPHSMNGQRSSPPLDWLALRPRSSLSREPLPRFRSNMSP